MRKLAPGHIPDGNLGRALFKAKPFSDTEQWCGYLTPSEALALIEAGGRARQSDVDRLKDRKAEGKSHPSWFYFTPGDALRARLVERHRDEVNDRPARTKALRPGGMR